jgi:DNA polymerase-3 subunit gamma/tau
VACLKIGGVASQLAHNCELVSWDGASLRLKLDPSCNQLRVTSTEERMKRAIEEALGVAVRLHLEVERPERETPAQRRVREMAERQQAAEATLMGDPLVRALQDQLGAQWLPGSVKPV